MDSAKDNPLPLFVPQHSPKGRLIEGGSQYTQISVKSQTRNLLALPEIPKTHIDLTDYNDKSRAIIACLRALCSLAVPTRLMLIIFVLLSQLPEVACDQQNLELDRPIIIGVEPADSTTFCDTHFEFAAQDFDKLIYVSGKTWSKAWAFQSDSVVNECFDSPVGYISMLDDDHTLDSSVPAWTKLLFGKTGDEFTSLPWLGLAHSMVAQNNDILTSFVGSLVKFTLTQHLITFSATGEIIAVLPIPIELMTWNNNYENFAFTPGYAGYEEST